MQLKTLTKRIALSISLVVTLGVWFLMTEAYLFYLSEVFRYATPV